MDGLTSSTICIGTFTSVSRTVLPKMMKEFKLSYPGVRFVLKQGEYTSISEWIKEGSVDFGFINSESVCENIQKLKLYTDEMTAVIPKNHPLTSKKIISLKDLETQPFILLDEGEYSLTLTAFSKLGLKPHIEYRVYDDYSILEMIRQNLGVSILYKRVLDGNESGLEIRELKEKTERTVALAFKDKETLSYSSKKFINYILKKINTEIQYIS